MNKLLESLQKFPYDFTYNPTVSFVESTSDTDVSLEGTELDVSTQMEGTELEDGISTQLETRDDNSVQKDDDYIWIPFKSPVQNLMIKDCNPDGNCQFRSIEQALYQYNNKYTHIKLRKIIGDYIKKLNDEEFQNIIDNYKIEKDNDEFIGNWDPYKVKSKGEFIKHINTLGFHFEGDDTTLNILSNILNVNFIIINKNKSVTSVSYTHLTLPTNREV